MSEFVFDFYKQKDILVNQGIALSTEIEIEARIVLPDNFEVNKFLYGLRYFERQYVERRVITDETSNFVLRRREYNNGQVESIIKSYMHKKGYYNQWCKLVLSIEKITTELDPFIKAEPVLYKRYYVDMNGDRLEICTKDSINYRIELEMLTNPQNSLNNYRATISRLYKTNTYMTRIFYDSCLKFIKNVTSDYTKPKTLTYGNYDQIKSGYFVSPKIDGIRTFIFIRKSSVICTDMYGNIMPVEIAEVDIKGSVLLDCELYGQKIYIIDILYLGHEDLRSMGFEERRKKVPTEISWMCKEYHSYNSVTELESLYLYFRSNYNNIDGIVFIPNSGYKQQNYKWKEITTVDLKFTEKNKLTSHDGGISFGPPIDNLQVGKVYEFSVDEEGNLLNLIRERVDKKYANSTRVIKSNIYDKIPSSWFTGICCKLMRKYHNKVKEQVLKTYNPKTLVDIGTGQGGDINKWNNIDHIVCIEPLYNQEFQRRSRNLKNITLLTEPISKAETHEWPQVIDMISCFFCLNMFTSEDYKGFLYLVSRSNVTAIIYLENYEQADNDVYSIKLSGPYSYEFNIYHTRIIGVKETVVNTNGIINDMLYIGKKLVVNKLLDEDKWISKLELELSSRYRLLVFTSF